MIIFYAIKKKDIDYDLIRELAKLYFSLFPNIKYNKIYDRIYEGYCYGEGGFRLINQEDWDYVLLCKKSIRKFFTVFDDWDDYFKYKGDVYKKREDIDKEHKDNK